MLILQAFHAHHASKFSDELICRHLYMIAFCNYLKWNSILEKPDVIPAVWKQRNVDDGKPGMRIMNEKYRPYNWSDVLDAMEFDPKKQLCRSFTTNDDPAKQIVLVEKVANKIAAKQAIKKQKRATAAAAAGKASKKLAKAANTSAASAGSDATIGEADTGVAAVGAVAADAAPAAAVDNNVDAFQIVMDNGKEVRIDAKTDDANCYVCGGPDNDGLDWIMCEMCCCWLHREHDYNLISNMKYNAYANGDLKYECPKCTIALFEAKKAERAKQRENQLQ